MKSFTKYVVITTLMMGTFFSVCPQAEAATTLRSAAMTSAKTQKGARYVWGAEGGYSRGYDCSGLIYWAYRKHGKTLPRTAHDQYLRSQKVSAANRKPGDLIFIHDARGRVFHVGIYTGFRYSKGWMLNANSSSYRGYKVVEAPIGEYTVGAPYATYGRY